MEKVVYELTTADGRTGELSIEQNVNDLMYNILTLNGFILKYIKTIY